MASTCRAASASASMAAATSAAQPTTPTLLVRRRRGPATGDNRPLAPICCSLGGGRSGTSSFMGGSGASSFASAPPAPVAQAAGGAAADPRSGASASFAASGPGRSGASSFGGGGGAFATNKAATPTPAPAAPAAPQASPFLKSLPTALTVARVLAIPFFARLWLSCPSPSAPLWCALLFAVSCFTDWLDGYLARLLDASTPFGAFLDPVADKLTVAAALVLLCTRAQLAPSPLAGDALAWVVPFCSIAIIGREISMSALREWAASLGPEARATVAVGGLGKVKTAAQMTAITLLLLTRDGGASAAAVGLSAGAFEAAARLGPPLLAVATVLTKWSLWQYLRAMWPWISGQKKPQQQQGAAGVAAV